MKRQTLIAKRYSQNVVLQDGTIQMNTPVTFDIRCSVQPTGKNQLEVYRFLRDYEQYYILYSDTPLQISRAGESEADTVNIYGSDYECLACESWQNKIRSHYKLIVGR
jgi:hypothetical protein